MSGIISRSKAASHKCLNSSQLRSKQAQESIRYVPSLDAVSTEKITGASLTSKQNGVLSRRE